MEKNNVPQKGPNILREMKKVQKERARKKKVNVFLGKKVQMKRETQKRSSCPEKTLWSFVVNNVINIVKINNMW